LEKEVPDSPSVISLTFSVDTPSKYFSIKANQSAISFL